jgi:hypothetical protein
MRRPALALRTGIPTPDPRDPISASLAALFLAGTTMNNLAGAGALHAVGTPSTVVSAQGLVRSYSSGNYDEIDTLIPPQGNPTFTAWVYPTASIPVFAGIVFFRGGGSAGGMSIGGTASVLGYTWNNQSTGTYNWNSGLTIPQNVWSFLALAIRSIQTDAFVITGGAVSHATNAVANTGYGGSVAAPLTLGVDTNSVTTRYFPGFIGSCRIYNRDLSTGEILRLANEPWAGLIFPSDRVAAQIRGAIPAANRGGRRPFFTLPVGGVIAARGMQALLRNRAAVSRRRFLKGRWEA